MGIGKMSNKIIEMKKKLFYIWTGVGIEIGRGIG